MKLSIWLCAFLFVNGFSQDRVVRPVEDEVERILSCKKIDLQTKSTNTDDENKEVILAFASIHRAQLSLINEVKKSSVTLALARDVCALDIHQNSLDLCKAVIAENIFSDEKDKTMEALAKHLQNQMYNFNQSCEQMHRSIKDCVSNEVLDPAQAMLLSLVAPFPTDSRYQYQKISKKERRRIIKAYQSAERQIPLAQSYADIQIAKERELKLSEYVQSLNQLYDREYPLLSKQNSQLEQWVKDGKRPKDLKYFKLSKDPNLADQEFISNFAKQVWKAYLLSSDSGTIYSDWNFRKVLKWTVCQE